MVTGVLLMKLCLWPCKASVSSERLTAVRPPAMLFSDMVTPFFHPLVVVVVLVVMVRILMASCQP